jgi:hypothetical protein
MCRLVLRNSKVRRILNRIAITAALSLLISNSTRARAEESNSTSILLPPPAPEVLALYEKPAASRTEREQWRIRIFGLRLAPLHPLTWGTLKRERTYNRHLVPIKRYFLRESEAAGFEVETIKFKFRFKGADPRYMEKMPHQKDPVFEIGFGGEFREDGMATKPLADRFYILRLSAYAPLASGIFERNLERYSEISLSQLPRLTVGADYDVALRLTKEEVQVSINGEEFVRARASGASKGLVTLQTSWHPIDLTELSIIGRRSEGGITEGKRNFSGLVSLKGDEGRL